MCRISKRFDFRMSGELMLQLELSEQLLRQVSPQLRLQSYTVYSSSAVQAPLHVEAEQCFELNFSRHHIVLIDLD